MAAKAEFLEALQHSLNGSMNSVAVEDNVRFYDSYIEKQKAGGRSEEAVLDELGDPRILSRTLIDAAERAGNASTEDAAYRGSFNDGSTKNGGYQGGGPNGGRWAGGPHGGRNASDEKEDGNGKKTARMPGWLIALIVILILVTAIRVIGSLVWAVLPYLIPILLVVWVIRIIRRT